MPNILRHFSFSINKLLLLVLASCLLYVTFLLVQKQNLVSAQDDTAGGNGGGGSGYFANYSDSKRYQCDGSKIVEVLNSGGRTSVKDCAADGSTCYSLQDDTKQQSYATCLVNPATVDTGAGCPTPAEIAANAQTTPELCRYLNPSIDIFDTTISQDGVNKYIAAYSPTFITAGRGNIVDFTSKVSTIVQKSQIAGLNPALVLSYWRSETAFGTAANSSDFGCAPKVVSLRNFDSQLDCALGNIPEGARASMCARSHDANSPSCQELKGIRDSHPDIYTPYPIKYPISTFDDFAEAYGSKAPNLDGPGTINNNCTHTYNTLIETAEQLGACKVKPGSGGGSLASCKFTRGNDTAAYTSQKLISYFEEVSAKTGVPAPVLAAITKVESTTDLYNISDYSDSDVAAMDNTGNLTGYVDTTIGTGSKALCPRSYSGALGLMQIQPPKTIINQLKAQNATRPFRVVNGTPFNPSIYDTAKPPNCDDCIDNGLRLARDAKVTTAQSAGDLKLEDYCNPKLGLYIGAGFILKKLSYRSIGDGIRWNPAWTNDDDVLRAAAETYYGNDAQTQLYVDSLITSVKSCLASTSGGNLASASCPIQTGTVMVGSKDHPVIFGPELSSTWGTESGHCTASYNAGEGQQCINFPQGTSNAIDIYLDPLKITNDNRSNPNDLAEIKFPTIQGHTASWELSHQEGPSAASPNEQIQGYSVTDLTTNDRFYVQFHHTKPGSAVPSGKSGDHAALVCGDGCGEQHTHVQIQSGSVFGAGQWLDATGFFCRDNTKYSHYNNSGSSPGF